MMDSSQRMKPPTSDDGVGKTLRSWLIVIGIALLFLCWGLFVFLTVGDKGPPRWDFGVVEDIPSWCNRTGNEYLGHEVEGDVFKSYVRKA